MSLRVNVTKKSRDCMETISGGFIGFCVIIYIK